MRSFKGSQNYTPSATQEQVYSPSRGNYQNRVSNTTDTSKNKNRTQQIVMLHQQFEDLKRKIKQVENKNEKIIEKIHRECNFKKKTPHTFDLSADTAPIVYYEKRDKSQLSHNSGLSVDESNNSDKSEFEFRQKKNVVQRTTLQSTKQIDHKKFSQSTQYNRVELPKQDLRKKYSKVSNKYDDQSIHSHQMLTDQFQQEPPIQFNMQNSHQTYTNIKDPKRNPSAKKSALMTPYHASQTHMGNFNPSMSQQDSRAPPSLFNPLLSQQQPPRSSQISQSSQSQFAIYQLQESLKIEKEKIGYLEEQLKSKQMQILNVKKDYNKIASQFDSIEMILEGHLDNFMENVVKKGFFDIEKQLKKSDNRLRNIAINVKDEYEEHKSSKLIKEHQLRRSNSRSKRDLSPVHNTSIHSVIAPNQQAKIPRPTSGVQGGGLFNQFNQQPMQQGNTLQLSQTSLQVNPIQRKSRISGQSKKNKQFEQIVQKYQQMINSKRDQISKLQLIKSSMQKKNCELQKELQVKQVQVKEMKQKLDELQKLMSDAYNEGPIVSLKIPKRSHRVSSAESNLLSDIQHFDDQSEARKFQLIYLETKEELGQKITMINQLQEIINDYEERTLRNESMIKTYEMRLKEFQLKVTKLQANSLQEINSSKKINNNASSGLDRIAKEKIQESLKKHLNELHHIEITHKDNEIQQFKSLLNNLQKKVVQKDCETISHQNKIKKLEGINQINFRKVEEYEKMLSHYQHNTSVDMGDSQFLALLDKSVCYDRNQAVTTAGKEDSGRKSNTRGSSLRQNSRGDSLRQNQRGGSLKQNITISVSEFEAWECQVKQMSQQILQLTKKQKSSQKINNQKSLQIERLNEQIQQLSQSNKKHYQQVAQLKSQLSQMEEKLQQMNNNQSDSSSVVQNRNRESVDFTLEQRRSQDQSSHRRKHTINQPFSDGQNNYSLKQQHRKHSEEQTLHLQQSITRLEEQSTTLKYKNIELSTQYNQLKSEHLQLSRTNINLKKDNEYLTQTLADREQKYQRYKRDTEQLKARNNELTELNQHKEEELKKEKLQNCTKIQQLQKQWQEFQQEINNNNNPDTLYASNNPKNMENSEILKTSRYNISESSMLLSSTIHNKNSQYLQQQNEYLTIKLKEAQATIEIHNMMEDKVLNQYKSNVDKLKADVKQKNKECESLRSELEVANDAKRRLQILYEGSKNYLAESRMSANKNTTIIRIASESTPKKQFQEFTELQNLNNQEEPRNLEMQEFPSYREDNNLSMMSGDQVQLEATDQEERLYPYERIIQLEGELKEAKDINQKLQEMEEELFKQIRLKEEEKKDLLRLIDDKNMKIQELEEIVELKEQNNSHLGSNILGSHISSSNHKSSSQNKNNLSQRQSNHSHSSLRYSSITHAKHPGLGIPSSNNLQIMGASQMGTSQRFEIQFSQTGSQMLDKSYVTNISQIFEKEQFPYEKVQLKRKEQIKLFQKTASYIKSLKDSINEKNKRIKLLQKKIESLKSNHHGSLSKQLENKYEISTKANQNDDYIQMQIDSVFKDYESVQLQRKKASHNKRYKNLQHEWKLAIEENNVLSNQVEVLQEQLEKAEEQENSILVMKDLYKEEIKKLLSKNQALTTYYEDLLAKEKRKVQESQSVHNIETIKQLFLKVMDAIIMMESEKSKKKREEKKKELEQFFKIFASLCAVQEAKKNAIIEGIKRMTLNIVLAQEGRSSSKSKE